MEKEGKRIYEIKIPNDLTEEENKKNEILSEVFKDKIIIEQDGISVVFDAKKRIKLIQYTNLGENYYDVSSLSYIFYLLDKYFTP